MNIAARPLIPGPRPLTPESDHVTEPILSHTFPNGLVLVAEPMAWLQSAAFTFLVPAGCAHDPPDENGLCSFTCEMALRGAGERDSRQFVLELDNLGVERSESVSNVHTSFSGATVSENLSAALAIFADLVRRPHLPTEQIEAGRAVLLQELRAIEDEPSQKVMIEIRRRHYPEPWGRPAHGEQEALERIAIDDIRPFFKRRYLPNGTILGVAGRFEWESLKEVVGNLLSDWVPGETARIAEGAAGAKYEHLPYDSNQTQIGIAWDSIPYCHPDYFQAWAAVGVLSGGMSARLFTEVREKRGLCYSVYANYHTLLDRGAVFCYAGTSAERAQETLDVTHAELVRLGRGIEEHELGRLKARIKSALVMQQESSFARSSSIARDWYHLGYPRTLDEVSQRIDELSCKTINTYLAEHPPRDFTVLTLGPHELEVPGGVS
jgi:predicted Zn-dependent peptidase